MAEREFLDEMDRCLNVNAILLERCTDLAARIITPLIQPKFYTEENSLSDVDGLFILASQLFQSVRKDMGLGELDEAEMDRLVEEYRREQEETRREAEEGRTRAEEQNRLQGTKVVHETHVAGEEREPQRADA